MWAKELQEQHARWLKARYVNQDPRLPLAGLIGEAGEAQHALLSEYKELIHGVNPRHTGHNAELLDAIGDCVIYMASWCNTPSVLQRELCSYDWSRGRDHVLPVFPLDTGHLLVAEACTAYTCQFPRQSIVDLIVAICVARKVTAEEVAMCAWTQVKERVR